MPSEDCPGWEYDACRAFARRWNMRPGLGWLATHDEETDEFLFQVPGEAEPRRFPAFVVDTDRGDTKVWAVIGKFSANDPNSGDQP
jgi:hypothetical protein